MEPLPGVYKVIQDLYHWLRSLQVNTKIIELLNKENKWYVSFDHPIKGNISCELPVECSEYIRLEGVGFKVEYYNNEPLAISCYDQGGIFDPIDNCVPGDHYAPSHFALICAILYKLLPDRNYLEKIFLALEFTRRIGKYYKFSEWSPHWEFDNFAWAEVYEIVKETTFLELINNLRFYLKNPPQHRLPFATNWKLLAVNYLEKNYDKSVVSQFLDLIRKNIYYLFIYRSFLEDGCIEDIPERSRSIQYHAYSAALLARLNDISPNQKYVNQLIKSISYLESFIDPDGVFNYKGRGQGQIFGYAVAIYSLLQGSELSEDKDFANNLRSKAELVYSNLLQYQLPKGYFPLVLNGLQDKNRVGWYSYNHLTVYNAMLGAWLGLALIRFKSDQNLEPSRGSNKYCSNIGYAERIIFHRLSKVHICKTKDIFFCVSAGEDYYEADCGFAPNHIHYPGLGTIVSCPGGPDINPYGIFRTEAMTYNFLTPLVLRQGIIYGPAKSTCLQFKSSPDGGLKMIIEYKDHTKVQRVMNCCGKNLFIEDEVICNTNSEAQLIGFNLPFVMNKDFLFENDRNRIIIRKGNGPQLIITLKSNVSFILNQKVGETAAGKILLFQSSPISFDPGKTIFLHQQWTIFKD